MLPTEMEDAVAVIGFSYRFPQDADSDDAFWNIIHHGLSTMTEVPGSRYSVDGYHSRIPGRQDTVRLEMSSRGSHFLKGDISAFDAAFFKMSGAEAKAMDPQLRLLLETAHHAFESGSSAVTLCFFFLLVALTNFSVAGISLDALRASATSVYIGSIVQEYSAMVAYDAELNPPYQATGNSGSMHSNRLSWFYDLRGPSVTIDTACSSSLVGIHLACQSLIQGEADMAIAGAVQLQLEPNLMTIPISRQGFLSPDSHCYSFDDRANGYSRGEGVGIIVLKRLSKALADEDMIRAVIRGTAVNQDGRTPTITQPSPAAQASLIQKAYNHHGLEFGRTGYFEAHGTGTAVGDPVEAKGISLAFSSHKSPQSPLYVGSVKANVGHLESCAGMAGVIKVVLMLEKGVIPPNALLKNLNPNILAKEWNLKVQTKRASVNSFGFGGTNAHVVLDDALHYLQSHKLQATHNTVPGMACSDHSTQVTANRVSTSAKEKLLFLLTAADEEGISRQVSALKDYLDQFDRDFPANFLQNLAFTLSDKRSLFPWKSFALAGSVQELARTLGAMPQKPTRATERPTLCLIFTGQGAQWAAMGKELLRYSVFRQSMELSDAYFRSIGSECSLLGTF
ncbi:Reducing polyketide synthase FUB1 [Metarhizium anisopliae]